MLCIRSRACESGQDAVHDHFPPCQDARTPCPVSSSIRTVLTRRSCGHCTPDSGMHPARTGRGLVAHAVICFAAAACVKAATQRPRLAQPKAYQCRPMVVLAIVALMCTGRPCTAPGQLTAAIVLARRSCGHCAHARRSTHFCRPRDILFLAAAHACKASARSSIPLRKGEHELTVAIRYP